MKEKGLAPLLVIIVAATILGGGILFYWHSQIIKKVQPPIKLAESLPSSKPSSASVETVKTPILLVGLWEKGTKTFSDSNLAITFDYPSSFLRKDIDTIAENKEYQQTYPDSSWLPYGNFFSSFYTPDVDITERQKPGFDWATYDNNSMNVRLEVSDSGSQTLDEFLKNHYSNPGIDGKTTVYEYLKKNLKTSSTPREGSYIHIGSGGGENPVKIVFFLYKNKVYEFSLAGGHDTGAQYSKDAEQIFDKIIASIKFL